ncbi:MAG: hypothetical protein ACLS2V_13565 [Clostridium paraputrificum]
MKKKAVITIKSNTLENDDDLVEVVSVGEFEKLMMDLLLNMMKRKFLEWMAQKQL